MKGSTTDWRHLSFVEAASAIEVFEIAHNMRIEPVVQRRILDHVVEEYQHADIFRGIANDLGQSEFRGNSAKKLIEAGGLDQDYLDKKSSLYKKLALIELGEARAIKALRVLQAKHEDEKIKFLLTQIEQEERVHSMQVSRYNGRYWVQILPHRLYYGVVFFFQGITQSRISVNVFGRLTRIFFGLIARAPLQKVAVLPKSACSKRTAMERSRMSI